ncbi:MAG: hypothetical protein KC478_02925 [Bacteriovoracaceae bacterium]|nr:hypothetical protein [Bacteriovoracaceae bacterium]
MKLTTLTALLCVQAAWASFPLVKVDKITGHYSDKKGKAFAQHASYDLDVVKIDHRNIEVEFNYLEENLVLNDLNTTVQINFDFSFLNVFRTLEFSGVDIKSTHKKFYSNLDELKLFIEPAEYIFTKVEISSDLTDITGDVVKDMSVLEGFINNGDVAVKSIKLGPIVPKVFKQQVIEENPELVKDIESAFCPESTNTIPVMGRNMRVVFKEQTFSGSLLLDSWINSWLYFGGKIKNDQENKKLLIDLYKAKLGIFSIRGLALRTIRNLKLDSVSVQGNRIIVDMGRTFDSGPNDSK